MALEKRFLHSSFQMVKPSRCRLIVGILLGVCLAFLLYVLMYYYRELLRVIWTDEYFDILILPREEMNFYNTICAFIAAIFGQSLCFTYWFKRPLRKPFRGGHKFHHILNDLWPLNFVFIGMLTGLVCEMGMIFFWRTEYEFGLYPDFNIYFILMIIVLFIQQWLTINRIFKRAGIKWMLISATVITAFSFGLSRANTDYDAFNQKFLGKSLYHNYHIDWPVVEDMEHIQFWNWQWYIEGNIYVVNSLDFPADDTPVVLMNNIELYWVTSPENPRMLQEVAPVNIRSTFSIWDEYKKEQPYYHDNGDYRLKINKNTPMSFVNRLKADLRASGVKKVRYALLPAEFPTGATYRYYDDWFMLGTFIPYYYCCPADSLKAALGSAGSFGNIIDICRTGDDSYGLNDKSIQTSELRSTIKSLVLEDNDYCVRYFIRDDDTFQDYIDVVVALHQAIGDLRAEYLTERNGKYSLFDLARDREAVNIYPLRILEITETMLDILSSN